MNSQKSGPVCYNHPSDTSDLLIQLTVHHQVMVKKKKVLVTQSCLTVCDTMDCSLPGPSVHGILQARILEWVTCPLLQLIFTTQG